MSGGVLDGVRVLEVGGIGPGPFAGMILADMGAEVIRVDRPGGSLPVPLSPTADLTQRGKRMVALDLKRPEAVEALLAIADSADVLIEGFRPGVAERLGFGPDVCLERNPRLVYGRMTGWGQDGPSASQAGHDVNYLAATGALHAIGPADGGPVIPLNLLGDYGGGSTYLAMGVLAALWHAQQHGTGQVVDAAIVDGVAHLTTGLHSFLNAGMWQDRREANLLDGGTPFYRLYETADGRHMAVGAIEPQFFAELCARLEISVPAEHQHDPEQWPALERALGEAIARESSAHWEGVFAGSDACVSPVPSLKEAPGGEHVAARGTYLATPSGVAPAPAPRFLSTPSPTPGEPVAPGSHTRDVLDPLGLDVEGLLASGAATQV